MNQPHRRRNASRFSYLAAAAAAVALLGGVDLASAQQGPGGGATSRPAMNGMNGGGRPRNSAATPQERRDPNSMKAHEELVAKTKQGQIDVYMIGDSIARRFGTSDKAWAQNYEVWKKNFWGWNVADFGWGADAIQNILWRAQNGEMEGINPKVFVILAGTNNVGGNPGGPQKVDDIVAGLKAIVDTCKEKAPNAKIILTGIFFRNGGRDGSDLSVIPEIKAINAKLKEMADDKTIYYVDINDKLADANGKLHEGMTIDHLHPSPKGYQLWADALNPLLEKFLGPRASTDRSPPPSADPSATK